MKKYLITLLVFLTTGILALGQSTDPLVSNCVMNAGSNAKYLKDFRVQLGKASVSGELRYKAQMSLWKNTKYRFSMCNSEDSKGKLIITIKDDANKVVISSFDRKTGKTYPFIDFICNKSGIYQLNYDFNDGQQGSGVGVVSMVR
jgi:hypothetical protein